MDQSVHFKCYHPSANLFFSGDSNTVSQLRSEFSDAAFQFGGRIKHTVEACDNQQSSALMTVEFSESQIIPPAFEAFARRRMAEINTRPDFTMFQQVIGLPELVS
jgi:hypothetical protein